MSLADSIPQSHSDMMKMEASAAFVLAISAALLAWLIMCCYGSRRHVARLRDSHLVLIHVVNTLSEI